MSDERTHEASWEPSSSDDDDDDDDAAWEAERQAAAAGAADAVAEPREHDEDAAWAARRNSATADQDSDSDEDDKPWNNFRKTHRLTEIARWKKQQGLDAALVAAVRAYSSRTVPTDEAQLNDAVDNSRADLKQVGLDIFFLSDGYCVSTTNFDDAERYRAAKKKEVEAEKKKRRKSSPSGSGAGAAPFTSDLDDVLSTGSADTDSETFVAPQIAARTSSSLAEQLRLAQASNKGKGGGKSGGAPSGAVPLFAVATGSGGSSGGGGGGGGGVHAAATAAAAAAASGGGRSRGFSTAAAAAVPVPAFAACASSSDEEVEAGGAGGGASAAGGAGGGASVGEGTAPTGTVLPLSAAALAQFGPAAGREEGKEEEGRGEGQGGPEWDFALSNWGEDRSMDAFDELLRQGWAMQLFRGPAGGESDAAAASAAPAQAPTPGDTLDLSFAASWWQDGAKARVHRTGAHVTLVLGTGKCLPAVEEALLHVPADLYVEVVVSPDSGAALSILGPTDVASPPSEGDYLVCRIHVHRRTPPP